MKVKYKALIAIEFEEEVHNDDLIENPKKSMDLMLKELLEDELPKGASIRVDSHYWENV
ncbi:MAG: hypothetical protein ACRC2K_13415 [Clostridium sp.]